MTQKLVDGVLVDLTPQEEAAWQAIQNTPIVGDETLSMGPSIAEQLGEPINVKS